MLFQAKQQICLHISRIRCLASNPSGRYSLRFFIYQRTQLGRKYAIPVNVIEIDQSIPSKYQLGQNYYITKPFLMKYNSQVKIEELCMFKIETSMLSNKNDEGQLSMELVCQLIHNDYGHEKIAGVFEGKVRGYNVKECLLVDFYDYSAAQVLGTIHSCSYQYEYCPTSQYPTFQSFCDQHDEKYVEQLISYLFKESQKTQQSLNQFYKQTVAMLEEQKALKEVNFNEDCCYVEGQVIFQNKSPEKQQKQQQKQQKYQNKYKYQNINKIPYQDISPKQTEQQSFQHSLDTQQKQQRQERQQREERQQKQQKKDQRKRRKIFGNKDRRIFNRKSKNQSVSIDQFEKMLHENSLRIYQSWKKIINVLMSDCYGVVLENFRIQYMNKIRKLMGESVVRFRGSWDIDHYSNEETQRNKMASQLRDMTQHNQHYTNQFNFYNKQFYTKNRPIYFQEGAQNSNLQNSLSKFNCSEEEQHIIFLVHGLGACRLDMQKLRVELKRYYPNKATIVISTANEGRTEGNIDGMGIRLATQVSHFLSKFRKFRKISFIGHSMGGVIIRSALPRLEKHSKLFYSFMTLSSPHIGYNYSSSKLVDAGIWVLNNWQKCQSIMQLTLSDKQQQQQSYLYQLSLMPGLQWFRKITFVSSHQDLYVPYYSARIQKHDECIQDQKRNKSKGIIHNTMINNLLNRIKCNITRIDVNFSITEQNIDNLIGRAAHINFIQNVDMLRVLIVMGQNLLF